MPTKPENRNYKAEAKKESPARQQARRDRKNARYAYEKAHGNLPTDVQVDHIRPISEGGTNAKKNIRAIPKAKNESFNRAGPGGKQIGKA
jgi:5-methylcytosine-specific restriction endonuclease McrA